MSPIRMPCRDRTKARDKDPREDWTGFRHCARLSARRPAQRLARSRHAVTLFEADARLGGHAHTHQVTAADGRELAIDTGFIVHNERTYPLLTRLFNELGVSTQQSEMSMSVHCAGCGLDRNRSP